jgi:hypothetical protein
MQPRRQSRAILSPQMTNASFTALFSLKVSISLFVHRASQSDRFLWAGKRRVKGYEEGAGGEVGSQASHALEGSG